MLLNCRLCWELSPLDVLLVMPRHELPVEQDPVSSEQKPLAIYKLLISRTLSSRGGKVCLWTTTLGPS